jgi:DNA-binding MarR family transcriptional regulator
MSDENAESTEDKKAAKAELKTAKKARKAAKEAEKLSEKAKRKAEKLERKQAEDSEAARPLTSEKPTKKAKPKKLKSSMSNSMSLGAKLQSVARLMRGNLAQELLAHSLYAGQEQVLFTLDEHGPLSLAELAEKLDVRAPTITKTVTRMEAQGFLSRATSRDDARSIIIALTPDGRRVLKICRQIVADIEAKTFSALKPADCESLGNMLDLVFSHVKDQK